MPVKPPTLKGMARTKVERGREHDLRRRAVKASRSWYNSARWKRLRLQQLSDFPLCLFCTEEGRVTPANVCDHSTPHREDEALFWSGPFQSLCKPCHDGRKQREEAATR